MDNWSSWCKFKVFLIVNFIENRQFILPVIFPYGDCENTHALQEVLVHLHTADCSNPNAVYQYDHFANNDGSFHQSRRTFHSPEAVVLLSSLGHAPEVLLTPPVYCRAKKSGVVVRVFNAPDVASVGTFVAPHYMQSLSLFPYTEEGETGNFQYHILQGANQPNEKSAFTVAILYGDTDISILPTRDLTAIKDGGLTFTSKADHYIRETYRNHGVLWLEIQDCNNRADTLTGSIVTSNKPIAVYTAKAECLGVDQFSNAAHVIHQMPPTKYWGKTFLGDTIAFQYMHSFQIVLRLVCDSDSTVEIVWYDAFAEDNVNVTTVSENFTLSATIIPQTVSAEGSNISHFSITSQHNLLVVYEICSTQNATDDTEVHSSVLLQPVEWFSHVQSVYRNPPRGDIRGQHHRISVVVHREKFDPEQIEFVWNFTQGNENLQNFGSNYSVYETGQYVLIHLDMTAVGLDAHTVQYKGMRGKLGATVYSVGGSQSSGLSYSNGYFRSEGDLEECYPGLSSSLPHVTSSDAFDVLTNTSTSSTTTSLITDQTEQPMHSSTTDGITTTERIAPSNFPTPNSPIIPISLLRSPEATTPTENPPQPTAESITPSNFPTPNSPIIPISVLKSPEATTLRRPTENPQPSTLLHSESTPTPVTRPSTASGAGTNTLAVAMGTTVGGLFILLLIFICLLVFFCFKTKRVRIVESYQMHDWGRPKYLRLEEPPAAGCEFDVLLSFAEEDCPFVENSIYHPLRRRGYSVFWHHDDFMPGLSIEENICRAIDKSRRIILVCTENFMNSAFCLMELHYSMVRQYQVGVRCIIAIIFDEKHCPRGLQGLNYIKLSRGDLDEEEIAALIDRLSLGEPVEPLHTTESAQVSPTMPSISSRGTREPVNAELIEEERQNWISDIL